MASLKQKAHLYHSAVSNYDIATITRMVREDYIQHNPRIPTGRAAFLALIPELQKHGTKIENLRMIEEGRFVAMFHHWTNATPFGSNEKFAFHVIRFDDNDLIAEHWSVMKDVNLQESDSDIVVPTQLHKTLRDGEFTLSIAEGLLNGKPAALYDLHRLKNGALTERWSIYQEIPTEKHANSNTMFGF